MKILIKQLAILLFLGIFFNPIGHSQNVAINSDGSAPDVSAALDIKSTNKGMLVPRMTTAQRIIIVSPATGLLVFDITTGSFWFYNSTSWSELSGGNSNINYWQGVGNDIYTINNGNAGIGISTPAEKLSIRGNFGLYSGTTRYGFMDYNNTNWRINARLGNIGGIQAENIILQHTSQLLTTSGKVGIGTDMPDEKLDVNGNIKLSGKINREATGAANLVPIAYGKINAGGSIANGTGNFTVDITNSTFLITVAGIINDNTVIVATLNDIDITENDFYLIAVQKVYTYSYQISFKKQVTQTISCTTCNPPGNVVSQIQAVGVRVPISFVIYKQ